MGLTADKLASIEALASAQRPGYSLDQRFYTDPDIYALELERIVCRNWFLAGHVSEFASAGDFRVFEVAGESAIVLRDGEGALRAFANVCRHRGSLVCVQAAGNARRFTCPYHGWTYGLDGRLVAARAMPEDFDPDAHGLLPVACEDVNGLVFVCFSPRPPRLDGCREALRAPMDMFGFDDLAVAARRVYDIPANWKLAVENYQECYHCAPAHPEYARMHTLMLDPVKRERVQQAMQARMAACGVDAFSIDHIDLAAVPGEIGYGYSRTALFDGYLTGSRDGKPVAPLLGGFRDYDGGASDFSFGAFSFLLAYSDHVVAYVFTPVEQHASRCEITWLVRSGAEAGRDYDIDELVWLWDVTTKADITIIVNNAKGVMSRHYRPGPLSRMERAEGVYLQWILRELTRGDENGAAQAGTTT